MTRAIAKAERYRLLNEPAEAESICLDALAIEPDNHDALLNLLVALDRTVRGGRAISGDRAFKVVERLNDPYERAYYSGIVWERRAKAQLHRGGLVSFEDLEAQLQKRYLDLAVLPEASVPIRMLQGWWMAEGADPLDVVETMDRLEDRSLVRAQADGRYVVHDVQRDFLLARIKNVRELHERWLIAFRPPDSNGWWSAPDDGYLLDHLQHHLRQAGHPDEWRSLLTAFEWLDRKTVARGFPTVLQDLLEEIGHDSIRLVERAGRGAAHVLSNDPAQLAAQLRARLDSRSGDANIDRLRAAARILHSEGWLCPINSELSASGDPLSIAFRGREPDGHAGSPRSIDLSSELSLIASGGGSSMTAQSSSGRCSQQPCCGRFAARQAGDVPLAFIARDGRLAVAEDDHVSIHTPAQGVTDATVRFAGRSVSDICRGPGDGTVIVAFGDGGIVRWNSSDESIVSLRESDGDTILALAHAATAPRVVVATESHVECRRSDDGTLVGKIDEHIDYSSRPLLLSVDETGSRAWFGRPAVEWLIDEGTSSSLLPGAGTVVAVTPSGRTAVAIPDDGSYSHEDLLVLDVQTAVPRGRIRNSRQFSSLALADTGDLVVTADYEHDVKVWDLKRATMDVADWAARDPVERTSICDDGGLALVVSAQGAEVWDAASGHVVDTAKDAGLARRLVRRGAPLGDPILKVSIRERMEAILEQIPHELIEPAGG